MNVHVQRSWRKGVKLDATSGLFAGLAQGSDFQRSFVFRLRVPSGLEPALKLRMVQHANALTRRIDNHGTAGEVRQRLGAIEGFFQLSCQVPHPLQMRGFFVIFALVVRE